ncbi:MAG: DUF58 domain-containing protein [Anaerolineae bacterium]|jgi:uncharacterized protein (DUF58 family)
MRGLLPFLIVLFGVAFVTKVDFFFYLLYALSGIYVLGRVWASRSLRAVSLSRHHERRVFWDERFEVQIEVRNGSLLPVLWMRIADTVPAELAAGKLFRQVVSLSPRERLRLTYTLVGRRRGYYELGPLVTEGGDLLGSASYEKRHAEDDHVIVYPKIVALRDLGFPSQSPFGTLPSRERLFEDPTRIRGVRDYQPGDSLRRMDWKTSARVGTLQVRRFEPAIALETAVFLNLDGGDYGPVERLVATELGIVIAASISVHLVEKRQSIGLVTNGLDPLRDPDLEASLAAVPALPLRKGREHLMDVLDLLARIQVTPEGEAVPFLDLLNRRSMGLPWGSTVVVLTSREVEGLLNTLLTLRRRGLVVILVTTCTDRDFARTARSADQIGIRALEVRSEQGMDVWR